MALVKYIIQKLQFVTQVMVLKGKVSDYSQTTTDNQVVLIAQLSGK